MKILSSLTGLFGGKIGLWAMIGSALIIASMFAYIQYRNAKYETLTTKLEVAQNAVKERDERIAVMEEDKRIFGARLDEINVAFSTLQGRFSKNTQQRRTDYNSMTSPLPVPGQPADLSAMQDQANNGMNGLFQELVRLSQLEAEVK